MGADVYLHSTWKAAQANAKPAFEAACAARDKHRAKGNNNLADKWQERVSAAWDAMNPPNAYWRDSYNSSNLFAQIGLDWSDVPLTTKVLPSRYEEFEPYETLVCEGDGLKWLINELRNRQIGNDYAETSQSKLGASVLAMIGANLPEGATIDGSPSKPGLDAEELAYFVRKKQALINLCQLALDLGEPLEVSY